MDGGPSDETVMRRLADGDESALAELMDRWREPIWCFVDRMCGRYDCTDDVYQEVWIRVYLYRRSFAPFRRFRPYLFAVAANCCRRALAGAVSQPVRPRRLEESLLPAADGPDPAEAVISREECQLLHRAIARLPETQRTVALLYLLFDTDYGHIAAVLRKSPATVRSHMYYALRNLRRTLGHISLRPDRQVHHERQPRRTD